jgi:hypothetical protein
MTKAIFRSNIGVYVAFIRLRAKSFWQLLLVSLVALRHVKRNKLLDSFATIFVEGGECLNFLLKFIVSLY